MHDYAKKAMDHLAAADAIKPGAETAERAAIEAQMATAWALLAIAQRLDNLIVKIPAPIRVASVGH